MFESVSASYSLARIEGEHLVQQISELFQLPHPVLVQILLSHQLHRQISRLLDRRQRRDFILKETQFA